MEPLTRTEKIQVFRGTLQTLGIIILILGLVWMIKHYNDKKIMGECIYTKSDGTQETTGLYGNCTWYDSKINDYQDTSQNWGLQNTHKVKYLLDDGR